MMKARVVEQEIDEYDLKNLNFAAFAKEHKLPRGNFFMYSRGTKSLAFLVSQWEKNSILPTLKASREIKK